MKQQELNADISRVKLFAVKLNFLPKEYFVIFSENFTEKFKHL